MYRAFQYKSYQTAANSGRYNVYRMAKPTRLRLLREAAGFKQASDFAAKFDFTDSTYRSHDNGVRPLTKDAAKRYAKALTRALGRDIDWLYLIGESARESATARPEALLVGKVGAGAEVTRLEEGVVLAGISLAQEIDGPNLAEIDGDSQYPLQPGWVISYGPEHQGIPDECVGKLSIVQIKDGPTLLKTLKQGTKKGLWRLESWNAPPREDVRVEWAAKVKGIWLK